MRFVDDICRGIFEETENITNDGDDEKEHEINYDTDNDGVEEDEEKSEERKEEENEGDQNNNFKTYETTIKKIKVVLTGKGIALNHQDFEIIFPVHSRKEEDIQLSLLNVIAAARYFDSI